MSAATLSAKRESFAHHYSASHNATAAAKAAGYSELRAGRTGHELLQRADVAALVRVLDAEKRAEIGIDEPWIVDRLVEIVEQSMQGVPRTSALGEFLPDPVTGAPIVDCDWTNANRALASLAKITGLNVPPTPAFGDTVYKLTLDRNLSEEGE